MNERRMEEILQRLFQEVARNQSLQAGTGLEALANARVQTLEDSGVLSYDGPAYGVCEHWRGVVLTLEDGSQFQITVVQSGRAAGAGEEDEEAA